MEKQNRGGVRCGAGRKKGQRSVPENQRAKTRGLSLPPAMWETLDTVAAREGVAVSAIIRRELTNFFAKNKTGESHAACH